MDSIWNSVDEMNTLGFAIRTLIVGLITFFAARLLPHRSGGQYSGVDSTFFFMAGGIIASPLFNSKISFANTIVATVSIYATHFIISYIAVKSRTFEHLVYGRAETLISKGQINKKNMIKSLFPIKMLLSQLREVDVFNIAEVDTAILETGGRVSVLKKEQYSPVSPLDLKLQIIEGGLPIVLINDGNVIEKNLKYLGYDKSWLKAQLFKYGISDFKNVYLATVDNTGQIYYSLVKE